ncbi:hypothetical protein THAOC_30850 [Thalassiosira oceanica]|uniref:GOLD domain-containing protein n=1 Tax=Thalassiosira oceanica TaxID=159749 RepID=K0RDA2_THAOC|nr:hypothetical protein THAOC_30850 [Thalassiosira oceanica]|eukprot:EJK50209.1 hypothetical protein THAOC_30850 [Thalassiosira oceanica]
MILRYFTAAVLAWHWSHATRGGVVVVAGADRVAVVYNLRIRSSECIYDQFQAKESVTYSVFVESESHGQPKATISFEGPISGNEGLHPDLGTMEENHGGIQQFNQLGRELRKGAVTHWPNIKDKDKGVRFDKRAGIINRELIADWTHAGEHEDAELSRLEARRKMKEHLSSTPKSDFVKTMMIDRIEPFEETHLIKADGWYRLCVKSLASKLLVEMDLRSSSQLGGIDKETGHVYTHEERATLDENVLLKSSDASPVESSDAAPVVKVDEDLERHLEQQIKGTDLLPTQTQAKHLVSLVAEMMKMHDEHKRRVRSHRASARRNYDGVSRSGWLETLLYVVVCGFQIYTVRKWLLQNSLLSGNI